MHDPADHSLRRVATLPGDGLGGHASLVSIFFRRQHRTVLCFEPFRDPAVLFFAEVSEVAEDINIHAQRPFRK